MKKLLYSIVCLCLSAPLHAEIWNVEVGGGGSNGDPYYSPSVLTIDEGDEVIWTWDTGQHNVTQTSGPVFFSSGTKTAPSTWSFIFEIPGVYEYECTIEGHSATQFGTITVNAGNSVPLLQSEREAFLVYPNPADAFIDIESNGVEAFSYHLLDLSGRQILRGASMDGNVTRLILEGLVAGIYILDLKDATGITRQRLTIR